MTVVKKFTSLESQSLQDLEREIAYFYDVANPAPIVENYMCAITCFEKDHKGVLKEDVIACLEEAYKEVKKQSALSFDPHTAACYEYNLIKSQALKAPTEKIEQIMVQIYQTVFQSKNPIIETIARLRTFLYQYKVNLVSKNAKILPEDEIVLRSVDQRSKALLKQISS